MERREVRAGHQELAVKGTGVQETGMTASRNGCADVLRSLNVFFPGRCLLLFVR